MPGGVVYQIQVALCVTGKSTAGRMDGNRFCLNLAAVLWLEKADENLALRYSPHTAPPSRAISLQTQHCWCRAWQTPFK